MVTFLHNIASLSLSSAYRYCSRKRRQNRMLAHSKHLTNNYLTTNIPRKLHLGCGSVLLPGWLNTDIDTIPGSAYLDVTQPFPFPDQTFDFIYSEHLLEHLTLEQQKGMLSECRRVLKKEGIFRLATPSMDFLFRIYADPALPLHREYVDWSVSQQGRLKTVHKELTDQESRHVYVINNFFSDWGHQFLHTEHSLKDLVFMTGFSRMEPCRIGSSHFSELQGLEKHGSVIPAAFNELETMVFEIFP